MTRSQLKKVLRARRGEFAKIAREANVSPSVVTEWFQGRGNSPEVSRLVNKRVLELLQKQQEEAVANVTTPPLPRARAS